MILTKKDTALLQAALSDDTNLFYWLNKDTSTISNNEYDTIRNSFQAWKEAYENDILEGITPGGTSFEFTGITQFPIPPSRN